MDLTFHINEFREIELINKLIEYGYLEDYVPFKEQRIILETKKLIPDNLPNCFFILREWEKDI